MSLCSPSKHSAQVWQNLIFIFLNYLIKYEVWINQLKETLLDPNNIQVFESRKDKPNQVCRLSIFIGLFYFIFCYYIYGLLSFKTWRFPNFLNIPKDCERKVVFQGGWETCGFTVWLNRSGVIWCRLMCEDQTKGDVAVSKFTCHHRFHTLPPPITAPAVFSAPRLY